MPTTLTRPVEKPHAPGGSALDGVVPQVALCVGLLLMIASISGHQALESAKRLWGQGGVGEDSRLLLPVALPSCTLALIALVRLPFHLRWCLVGLPLFFLTLFQDQPLLGLPSALLIGSAFSLAPRQRLLRLNPDLHLRRLVWPLRHRYAPLPKDADASATLRRESRRAWVLCGVMTGVLWGATGLRAALNNPPDLRSTIERFQGAWERRDAEAVASFCAPERRESTRNWLVKAAQERAWGAVWPPMVWRREVDEESHREAAVETIWRHDKDLWVLDRLKLPPPPIGKALLEFRDAWNAIDPEAVASLGRNDERIGSQLVELGKHYDWGDRWPAIDNFEIASFDFRQAEVDFILAEQRIRTSWSINDQDDWLLDSVKTPDLDVSREPPHH